MYLLFIHTFTGMQVLIDARQKLEIPWENNERENDANYAKLIESSNVEIDNFIQWSPYIRRLWQDRGIRRAYERRREFQIVCLHLLENRGQLYSNIYIFQSDSVSYFLNDIDRLATYDYVPTHKDILHCRKATKGVYEFCVKIQVSN